MAGVLSILNRPASRRWTPDTGDFSQHSRVSKTRVADLICATVAGQGSQMLCTHSGHLMVVARGVASRCTSCLRSAHFIAKRKTNCNSNNGLSQGRARHVMLATQWPIWQNNSSVFMAAVPMLLVGLLRSQPLFAIGALHLFLEVFANSFGLVASATISHNPFFFGHFNI